MEGVLRGSALRCIPLHQRHAFPRWSWRAFTDGRLARNAFAAVSHQEPLCSSLSVSSDGGGTARRRARLLALAPRGADHS